MYAAHHPREDTGSSPRVRGKLDALQALDRLVRLIPACAGKTWSPRARSASTTAHPRVCGENDETESMRSENKGSSPRVRGKRFTSRAVIAGAGLIPACAGKTGERAWRACHRGAHPRVCGENPGVQAGAPGQEGSSPRVRGKLHEAAGGRLGLRLIPACAGKTRRRARTDFQSRAHPRVCGENSVRATLPPPLGGSSPRVRGKPVI